MKSVLQTEHAGLKLILHTFQISPSTHPSRPKHWERWRRIQWGGKLSKADVGARTSQRESKSKRERLEECAERGGNDLFGYASAGTNNSSSNIQLFLFHMMWIFHRLHTGVQIISSCGSSWRTKTITLFTKKSTVYCINRWPLLTYFTILTYNVISLLTLWLLTFNRLCVKELE